MNRAGIQETMVTIPSKYIGDINYLDALLNSLHSINDLKARHYGKRCFIVNCNNDFPDIDWPLLSGETIFCVDESYSFAISKGLSPAFIINSFNVDPAQRVSDTLYAFGSNRPLQIYPLDMVSSLPEREECLFIRTTDREQYVFATDIADGFNKNQTNALVAMQLAFIIGFSQVFLLGVEGGGTDCVEAADLPIFSLANGLNLAKGQFENDGRVVVDVTPSGSLTIFPKASFNDIFAIDRQIADKCAAIAGTAYQPAHHDYPILVTAIVSTYNAEAYIRECLEDLERQTIADRMEIIVVISGSQQNEEDIVTEFSGIYDNIKIIKTARRESVYQAWNRAIKIAQGKYLTNANTDDRHTPDAFEKMARIMEADPSKSLVYMDQKYYREIKEGVHIQKEFMFNRDRGPFSRNRLLEECFAGSQPMWRADMHDEYGYFDEAFFTAGDYEFWLRVSQNREFFHLNELLGERLIRDEGLEYSGNSYLSYIESAAITKSYAYATLHGIPIDASGLSAHPVFSKWCELNLIKHNTMTKLGISAQEGIHNPRVIVDARPPKRVPALSVIITTFNRKEDLLLNLQALNSQACLDFEVIVVNNGEPIKELSDCLPGLAYPFCYLENSCNFGPSHARNLGASIAGSEIVAILDDDAIADPAWAGAIIRHFNETGIAALRGKVRPKNDNGSVHIPVNYDLGDSVIYNTAGLEMNTAFRRDLFDKLGGYDIFLFGFEGAELSYRIFTACDQQLDCIKYFPDVVIYHDFPESPDRLIETPMRLKGMKKAICKKWPEIECYMAFMWGMIPANRDDDNYAWLTGNAFFCLNGSPKEASFFARSAIEINDREPLAFFIEGSALLKMNEDFKAYSSLNSAISIVDDILSQYNDLSPELISYYEMIKSGSRKGLEIYTKRMRAAGTPPLLTGNRPHITDSAFKMTFNREDKQQILERSRQRLSFFKDRHKGQRCVIIGNGPSLNKMDLSFLENEITFGMNRIYLLFDKWKFRPSYYVTVNPLVIEQSAEEILSLPMPKFVSHKGVKFFHEPNDIMFLDEHKEWVFSKDPLSGLHEGWTVTYVAMQLAYFMGFSEVILIGVDHHFVTQGDPNKEVVSQGTDPNHFHPDYFGKGTRWHLPDLERSEGSYLMARKAFEADNRRIIDATVDGKLTLFPKADYRELFSKKGTSPHTTPALAETYMKSSVPHEAAASPRVSIVIPCYNYGRFLANAVESALFQTFQDFEIIIVNDGSTDNSREVAEQLIAAHPGRRISLISQENSGDPAIARNRGIREARGGYILCLDADDLIMPEMLEKSVALLDAEPGVAIAYTDQIYFGSDPEQVVRVADYDFNRLIQANFMGYCSLFRKQAWLDVGGYPTGIGYEDWDFWISCGEKGHFGRRIPEPLFCYRQHTGGRYALDMSRDNIIRARVVRKHPALYTADMMRWADETIAGRGDGEERAARDFRVVAIISAHNEGDVIYHVIGDLALQGIGVYLINHCSTDNTVAQAAQWLGKGLLHIENFPQDAGYPEANKEQYIWHHILQRKEELAARLDADWFIHSDADEFRESPWPGLTLKQAIQVADRMGYNALDFELFNFRPVNDYFVPGTDVREALRHYEGCEEFNANQIKAWKNLHIPVGIFQSGGHDITFPGRSVCPVKFLLRHYPIRGQSHGERKVFRERKNRFNGEERNAGWHVQYDAVSDERHNFLYNPASLVLYDGDQARLGILSAQARAMAADIFKPEAAAMEYVPQAVAAAANTGTTGYDKPADIHHLVERGDTLANAGKPAEAISCYHQVLAADPGNCRALVGIGVAHILEGNHGEAALAFSQALKSNPTDTKALCGLGMARLLEGRGGIAINYLKKSLDADPENLTALHELVKCAYQIGKFDEAEAYLERYLMYHPADLDILFSLGGILYKTGAYEKARDVMERLMALSPDYQDGTELLESICMAAANNATVKGANEIDALSGNSLVSIIEQGRTNKAAGNYDAAFDCFTKARRLGDLTVLSEMGDCKANIGDMKGARDFYEEGLLNNADDVRSLVGLGVVSLLEENLTEAGVYFGKALKVEKENPKALCGLAMLRNMEGRARDAHDLFTQALDKDPENLTALFELVKCAYRFERFDGAERHLRNYLRYHPADLNILFSLAGVLFKTDKGNEALEQLDTILVFDPEFKGAWEMRQMIGNELQAAV